MKPIARSDRRPTIRSRLGRLLALALVAAGACDRPAAAPRADGVVSLSPAATGLVVAIGAGDRLVGVSTYEADPGVAALPRVGDYENVDWERIRGLAPRTLITQQSPDRLPAGFVTTARAASIAICPVHIDRLADIGDALAAIGDALDARPAADAAWAKIMADLESLRVDRGKAMVPTLIVTSDDSLGVAGGGTFLDDLLPYAGGINALGTDRAGYLSIDREQLRRIDPAVILVLAPAATPDAAARARETFEAMPELAAVKAGRVRVLTRGDVLMPNANVAKTAREFADAIDGGARR